MRLKMSLWQRLFAGLLVFLLFFLISACAVKKRGRGEVIVLFTSDIHCGVDSGFGLAGLWEIRNHFESEGYATILVDDGDAIQGEPIGGMTQGSAIIELMNDMHYDVAVPGNHEFDYGVDSFLALVKKASFPYVCCNFAKGDSLLFAPYVIKEVAGVKIAFVGITTPTSLSSSTPSYFKDEKGEFQYSFMEDLTGDPLYEAVQTAVDAARTEGADYVYALAHLGNDEKCSPWTCHDVISHTNGIDVFLDGHSHDTDQLVIKNKDGKDVVRSAVGSKLNCVGLSHIVPKKGTIDTKIWSWAEKENDPEFCNVQNDMGVKVRTALEKIEAQLSRAVAVLPVELSCLNVRAAETNLGDFCTDAFRALSDADIAVMNAGGIRANLKSGTVSYGDVLKAFPFGNSISVIEASGQQILDALEWSARMLPKNNGGFLQLSGISCEVDVSIPNGCIADQYGMCIGIEGERRVKNVMVEDRPIEPARMYTLAGPDYILLSNGDGMTAFNGARLLGNEGSIVNCVAGALCDVDRKKYEKPSGQERMKIVGY